MGVTLRTGNVFRKFRISDSDESILNCPLGLLISELTFANMQLGAIPTLQVSPVALKTPARNCVAT